MRSRLPLNAQEIAADVSELPALIVDVVNHQCDITQICIASSNRFDGYGETANPLPYSSFRVWR